MNIKAISVILLFVGLVFSCKQNKEANTETVEITEYDSFGDQFDPSEDIENTSEALETFENLHVGDSVHVQIEAPIQEVCEKKGCFMILDLGDDQTARVTFKDYGFFVPKDVAGQETIINGWAHKSETSVEQQKHYAQDMGKSTEEIDAITEPKIDYTFVADGVLIKKKLS